MRSALAGTRAENDIVIVFGANDGVYRYTYARVVVN